MIKLAIGKRTLKKNRASVKETMPGLAGRRGWFPEHNRLQYRLISGRQALALSYTSTFHGWSFLHRPLHLVAAAFFLNSLKQCRANLEWRLRFLLSAPVSLEKSSFVKGRCLASAQEFAGLPHLIKLSPGAGEERQSWALEKIKAKALHARPLRAVACRVQCYWIQS